MNGQPRRDGGKARCGSYGSASTSPPSKGNSLPHHSYCLAKAPPPPFLCIRAGIERDRTSCANATRTCIGGSILAMIQVVCQCHISNTCRSFGGSKTSVNALLRLTGSAVQQRRSAYPSGATRGPHSNLVAYDSFQTSALRTAAAGQHGDPRNEDSTSPTLRSDVLRVSPSCEPCDLLRSTPRAWRVVGRPSAQCIRRDLWRCGPIGMSCQSTERHGGPSVSLSAAAHEAEAHPKRCSTSRNEMLTDNRRLTTTRGGCQACIPILPTSKPNRRMDGIRQLVAAGMSWSQQTEEYRVRGQPN